MRYGSASSGRLRGRTNSSGCCSVSNKFSGQFLAPCSRTVTGTYSALKYTPARGIFSLKGLRRGSVPLLKGVPHAQAYDNDHGACESVCLRRVSAATLFLCPLARTCADPAKNRPLSSDRQT